ncbi:MAG: putative bifunctional diguanylate cyclase/phosphodiesterase [Lautropia sp.]
MDDSTAPRTSADTDLPVAGTRRAGLVAWAALALVAVTAIGLVALSITLRAHADSRREVMRQLTAMQVDAAGQNTLVWRAMTQLMAGEKHGFIRTRSNEQIRRNDIVAGLERLLALEKSGDVWNERLGIRPAPELLDALIDGTERFLASVRSAFGLMNLSREQLRERLGHWDMNYGDFEAALNAVRSRDDEIATISARVADRVTGLAASISLIAALLFVARLGQVRARRQREMQQVRLRTIAASESRFRALVQHAADLIMIVEPQGVVRYASPSAARLLGATVGPTRRMPTVEQFTGLGVQALLERERNEVRVQDAEGTVRVYEIRARDLGADPAIGGIVLNGRDVTDAKALEDRLRHQALHDPLTGLPNRRSFVARIDALDDEARAARCVLFIDLDGFKLVNDSYGHSVGDQLLIHTAARIGTCLDADDLLVRQGGDEFIVLCSDASVADRIQAALVPPFEIGHGIGPGAGAGARAVEIFVSASIGVVPSLVGLDAEQAAQRADIAMYKAKDAGKAQAIVFSEDMLDGAPERLALESDFRRALERDEFTVVYQPKVGLKSGITESLEALVRWIHPTRGFVGPDLFIPFAEESGLVHELGRQILRKACMDAVRWQPFGVVVAVNLSPIQFRNARLADEVREALDASGLDPAFLELEITESAVLGDVQNTIRVMRELKALGIRLAIDDFGTGYSNLAHLKHFDVDVLKIDQAFVRGDGRGTDEHLSDGAIVQAVIGMAKAFDMHVVAEGVESASHARELTALGADLGQGYFFSKPVSGQGIDDFLDAEVASGRRTSPVREAV